MYRGCILNYLKYMTTGYIFLWHTTLWPFAKLPLFTQCTRNNTLYSIVFHCINDNGIIKLFCVVYIGILLCVAIFNNQWSSSYLIKVFFYIYMHRIKHSFIVSAVSRCSLYTPRLYCYYPTVVLVSTYIIHILLISSLYYWTPVYKWL